MELDRRTWSAAVRLAMKISLVAVLLAVIVSTLGDVPQAAIVLPVIVVAFVTSWVQTGRVRRATIAGCTTTATKLTATKLTVTTR